VHTWSLLVEDDLADTATGIPHQKASCMEHLLYGTCHAPFVWAWSAASWVRGPPASRAHTNHFVRQRATQHHPLLRLPSPLAAPGQSETLLVVFEAISTAPPHSSAHTGQDTSLMRAQLRQRLSDFPRI